MDLKIPRYSNEPSDLYDMTEVVHNPDSDVVEFDGDIDDNVNELSSLHKSNAGRVYDSITNSIFAHPNCTTLIDSSIHKRHSRKSPSTSDDLGSSDVSILTIIQEYTAACQIYGCSHRINAGVLTTFRFRLPSLRVSGSFFDADMLALVEVLLHHINGALSYIRRLDFSVAALEGKQFGKRGVRSHGAYALSKVLEVSLHIEEVFLPGNRIGPYGAAAIFSASRNNPKLRTLLMRGCRIGERGAFALVSQILMNEDGFKGRCNCGMRAIDVSVNQIGFYGVSAIENGLKTRMERMKAQHKDEDMHMRDITLEVDMEGNLIFQEVMNCVTHGLGILLAVIGTILLSRRVQGKPRHYVISCAVYSTSLIVLYMSSTLFHSFFALPRTRYIFQVFDMCAIYILIAGSYTPFLIILLHHDSMRSAFLLAFIWLCGLSGIGVEAFFPLWKWKPSFSLAMYLGMGWSCMVCMKELVAGLPSNGLLLLVAGGLWYTTGVPFFVRNNNLDHSIWHCFVMAGSICHWLCIYDYVVV